MKSLFTTTTFIFSILLVGCETPADSFERRNSNDPLSKAYEGGAVTGLQVIADASGIITLNWPESNSIVTKNVVEKSLGDSLNFQAITELGPKVLQFSDSTREVRKNTYYRLSSFIEIDGEEDILYGRSQTVLEFGEILDETFEFLSESNSLQIAWITDVPFYTHFIISSENMISEQQERTVKITADQIEHLFVDPLLDIDFETRNYTITGIIEHEEIEEVIIKKEISFDAKSFFQPKNLEINFLNEQNWEITWDYAPFFATEVELIRTYDDFEVGIFSRPPDKNFYVDSLIIEDTSENYIANRFRKYQLRFINGTTGNSSIQIENFALIDIQISIINNSGINQNDPNSITIYWDLSGEDKDQIVEFVIEKENPLEPGEFQEIERVDGGGNFEYTDINVSESDDPTYRVRTITSRPSDKIKHTFSHDYQLDYSFDTGMNYVTSMEVSSDKKYLAAVSFWSEDGINTWKNEGNPILITDIESRESVASIHIPFESISDFKISPDEEFIYFVVQPEGDIYKAEFPSGHNIEKVIEDTFRVMNFDISNDGTFLIGHGGRGDVKRWNLNSYEADFQFAETMTPAFYSYKNIAISPDGNVIAGNNGSSFIIDAKNGSILQYLEPWTTASLSDLQFSTDGNFYAFVTSFWTTEIYSTTNWERTRRLFPGSRSDFHPEKSSILLSGYEWTITYDLETNNIIDIISDQNGDRPYTNYMNKITYIDDDRIATVAGKGTIQIWKKKDTPRRWKRAL